MNKEYIEVKIPVLDNVEQMKVVETFTQEQLWYVCAIAKAFEKSEKEIDRLTAESTHYESKYYNEAKKVDKALERLSFEKEKMGCARYHGCFTQIENILRGDINEN